ncbi:efflux RND transporter periplasmic adaptor subunit [Motilimonas sp. KMU-193]|uniref:efflux RND transporter periplasmic adaptor subunit n=1 Tax=Motilimonas sp. KMU-193 TaxID=3388668 RepID=UPI00396B34CE
MSLTKLNPRTMARSFAFSCALLPTIMLFSYPSLAAQGDADDKTIASITVIPTQAPTLLTFNATIEAVNHGTVSAQTSGRITQLNYDVSDRVPAGATLLTITDTEQAASILAAKANVSASEAANVEAQLNLKRLSALYPKGAISKGQLDQAKANAQASKSQLQAALAQLTQAEQAHSYTQVHAPFAGVVTERHVQLGEAVNVGTPLYSGFALDKLRAVVAVPQSYLAKIHPDNQYTLLLNDQPILTSNDAVLFNYANSQSHSVKLRVNFDNPEGQLLPGMWVKVEFAVNAAKDSINEQIWLPRSAVLEQYQLTGVYLKTERGWQLTPVRIAEQKGDSVLITSGLHVNDIVAEQAQQLQALILSQQKAHN